VSDAAADIAAAAQEAWTSAEIRLRWQAANRKKTKAVVSNTSLRHHVLSQPGLAFLADIRQSAVIPQLSFRSAI
jgi:hypothetical protein